MLLSCFSLESKVVNKLVPVIFYIHFTDDGTLYIFVVYGQKLFLPSIGHVFVCYPILLKLCVTKSHNKRCLIRRQNISPHLYNEKQIIQFVQLEKATTETAKKTKPVYFSNKSTAAKVVAERISLVRLFRPSELQMTSR